MEYKEHVFFLLSDPPSPLLTCKKSARCPTPSSVMLLYLTSRPVDTKETSFKLFKKCSSKGVHLNRTAHL